MKKLNNDRDNRAPITADNLMQAARAAAYVTVRRAYLSTPRSLRDASGEVCGYDGATTGGTDMIRNFLYEVCGAKGDWTMGDYKNTAIAAVRETRTT